MLPERACNCPCHVTGDAEHYPCCRSVTAFERDTAQAAVEKTWKTLWAYHADDAKRCARDDDGTPNVYNTLLLILDELFPERMKALRDDMERSGR